RGAFRSSPRRRTGAAPAACSSAVRLANPCGSGGRRTREPHKQAFQPGEALVSIVLWGDSSEREIGAEKTWGTSCGQLSPPLPTRSIEIVSPERGERSRPQSFGPCVSVAPAHLYYFAG